MYVQMFLNRIQRWFNQYSGSVSVQYWSKNSGSIIKKKKTISSLIRFPVPTAQLNMPLKSTQHQPAASWRRKEGIRLITESAHTLICSIGILCLIICLLTTKLKLSLLILLTYLFLPTEAQQGHHQHFSMGQKPTISKGLLLKSVMESVWFRESTKD